MTTEHKDIDDLKSRFEDGDRPTGEDFAHLIDSCHNTRQLTDVTITETLSVQGDITIDGKVNTRDVAADGSKLDSLDSFVRNNSDSWEETADIQAVTTQLQTVSSVLSGSVNSVNDTLSALIIDNVQELNDLVDTNNTNINNLVTSNHTDINTRVDGLATGLGDTQDAVNEVTTTVFDNSASWGVDENTNSLHNLLDVEIGAINHSDVLKFDANDGVWRPATDLHGEGQHVDTFLELHDTSVAYTGAGKFVKINETNDGLTFVEHASDDWDSVTTTVKQNSGSWGSHTDISQLENDISNISSATDSNASTISNIESTVETLNNTVNENGQTISQIQTDLESCLTDYTVTQADVTGHQAALSITESQISDLGSYITDYTVTQADVTNHQAALSITESQISDLGAYLVQSDVDDIQTDLDNLQDNITEIHNVSGSWALLDDNGILHVDQIPELSITQTYTVQNPEEVATLNPAEGIQRGDIVIVTSSYDNLVAKQDNPTGTYNSSTKAYSGYSKLARPDAYVTSVNDMYGNVTISSDNIDDTDNTNKWVTQVDIDKWNDADNKFVNSTGDTMTGDLDTTANILSGGRDLSTVFWVKGDDLGTIGNYDIQGEITADGFATKNTAGDPVVGITQDVNVGGNILHIVNGIIVGVTDEA